MRNDEEDPKIRTDLKDIPAPAERSGLSVFAATLLAQPIALVITILIVKVMNISWILGLLVFLVVAPLTVLWLVSASYARNAKAAQKKEVAAKQSLQGSP